MSYVNQKSAYGISVKEFLSLLFIDDFKKVVNTIAILCMTQANIAVILLHAVYSGHSVKQPPPYYSHLI